MIGTGALLAMGGHRVGMLDFDLDASGLATIFQIDADGIGNRELLHILERADPPLGLDSVINITNLISERFAAKPKGDGCLQFIPTISDPELADKITFNQAMRLTVTVLLDTLLEHAGLDMLLIDLRPGYSASSALILPHMDRVVVVARLDNQNIHGLRRIVPHMTSRGLKPILAANLIPPSHPLVGERLKMLEEAAGLRADVCIEYEPEAAFDDDIQLVTRPDSSLRRGLEALVELLQVSD